MNLPEKHFKNTEKLLRAVDKGVIASWLLNEGYFPEQYVLPPSFKVSKYDLKAKPFFKDLKKLKPEGLECISYPKSLLTSRVFGIQHPSYYHDIVYHMIDDWDLILDHLFQKHSKIFSYSLPIPVTAKAIGQLSTLRSGRMIYEWIEMAERDMVAEAHRFKLIIRADITNFYNSVYTHSIGWALHGRSVAFKDKHDAMLTGSKIDRLVQYANEAKTNGIPVGSSLSDLVAEIVLATIDNNVSTRLENIKFIGSRFKDDYRILCDSEDDAKQILKVLSEELVSFNLLINEHKTKILPLPEGLYRAHDREYHLYSLRKHSLIPFKTFEVTLLKALDIHRKYPGTSILEKFFSELYNGKNELKINFSTDSTSRQKQVSKTFSLLMLVKRESEKVLCHSLAVCESLYEINKASLPVKTELKIIIESEIQKASDNRSVFELVWLVYFSLNLNLGINCKKLIPKPLLTNEFLNSLILNRQTFFPSTKVELFRRPSICRTHPLAKYLSVFDRTKE
jgi:hypothetical protein